MTILHENQNARVRILSQKLTSKPDVTEQHTALEWL